MEIKISKGDIIWSFLAKFFNIAAGFITLPLVLNKLTADEVGLNYLMLTVGTLVALIDFGFAPQFGRNITYVLSGSQTLQKEGVATSQQGSDINYRLLANVLAAARYIYRRLSIIVLFLMLTLGTLYIYKVTDDFSTVNNTPLIWFVYCVSVFFNIYYCFYSSFLTGAGQIREAQKAMMLTKIAYILLSYLFLLLGWGLLGVVLANLISPFVNRFYSHYHFYTPELKSKLCVITSTETEIKHTISVLWYNAKKLGINFVGSYAINKFSMFLAGLFLSLSEVGTYGLMIQFTSIVMGISVTVFSTYIPLFSNYRTQGKRTELISTASFGIIVMYLLFIVGILFIVLLGPWALSLIHSKTVLPSTSLILVYSFIILLENNHSQFATLITTNNEVPFVKAAIVSGLLIAFFTYLVLQFTNLALWGIILVQGIVQLSYNNWYWPYYAIKRDLNTDVLKFYNYGLIEMSTKLKNVRWTHKM